MDSSRASAAVIALASRLLEQMSVLQPGWTKGFFRFRSDGTRLGSNASYVANGDVLLISAVQNARFYDDMIAKGAALFQELDKTHGVFLLTVDAPSTYDVKFEWDELNRWEISKAHGGAELPKDL